MTFSEDDLSVLSGKFKSVAPTWLQKFTLEHAAQQYLDILDIPVR